MIGLYVLITHSLYLALAVWATVKAARFAGRRKGGAAGAGVAMFSLFIFALIPVWDELLALPVYNRLCEKAAVIEIYGKMPLPRDYYSKDGQPLFVHKNGNIDGFSNSWSPENQTDLHKLVEWQYSGTRLKTPVLVEKDERCLVNIKNKTRLMCETTFFWRGGWWRQRIYGGIVGSRGFINPKYCGPKLDFRELHDDLFYPETNLK